MNRDKVQQLRYALLIWVPLGLLSCSNVELSEQAIARSSPTTTVESNPIGSERATQVASRLVAANTRFGFKLFSQILQQNQGGNVLLSPFSVVNALSMLYNGASGDTQREMAKAMALQEMTVEEVNRANADLKTSLENADPKVKLAIANSLWGRSGFSFKPDFLKRNQDFSKVEAATLDFSSPNATNRINTWVSEKTEGKIPKIIDRIAPDEVLFLINAVYFKGNWTTQFDASQTRERPFNRLDGSQKQHPMMSQSGKYQYYETEQFQAVSLPYGDGRLSMYIFLPKSTSNLKNFSGTLTPENWDRWLKQFSSRQGSIQIPRFEFEYSARLNDVLAALGMQAAFDRKQANFSGISSDSTYINRVQHKTFIEVNEEGTEAAATTSVGVTVVSAPTVPPFQMLVDRPFFYAIRDNQAGTILFMGSVVEPE